MRGGGTMTTLKAVGRRGRTLVLLMAVFAMPALLSGCATAADYPQSTAGQLLVATPG